MGLLGGPERIDVYTRGQKQVLGNLTNALNRNIGQGAQVYGGQIIPGATANQQLAFGVAPEMLRQTIDSRPAIQGLLSGAPAYTIDPAARERLYNEQIVAPAQNRFRDTLQQLDARYGGRFGIAGAQGRAVSNAARDFETNLAGQRASLLYADEQARRQALENGMGRVAAGVEGSIGYDQNRRQGLEMLAALGGAERGIGAQQAGEQYYKWNMGQDYNNPWLGFLGTALSASPYAVGQSEGVLGAIGGLAGGMGKLAGGIGDLFG